MHDKIKSIKEQQHFVSTQLVDLAEVDAIEYDSKPSTVYQQTWHQLKHRPAFWISFSIIAIIVICAIFPQLFTSNDPSYCDLSYSLAAPTAQHWFGFDRQGCDIFARVIYGTRASLSVGIFSAIIVFFIGSTLGALAGYYGGIIDSLISRLIDIFFAVPGLLAAIVSMQMFKDTRSVFLVVFILSAFGWIQIARITRSSVISVKNNEFVTSARALGLSDGKILLRHIIPNAITPTIVYTTVILGGFIVAEASLSFLGLGLPPSVVSWGADIAKAQVSLRNNPMVLFYPSMALALTMLSFILLGDVIRDAINYKGGK